MTTKHPAYVLFAMTPSERAAVGLTDKQVVHLLVRTADGEWRIRHQWEAARYSHTEFMAALHYRDEPADPERLLDLLPTELR
ncbi:MAG: hypothetical protein HYR72_23400 [Deltaproteobacteria bacterium]|nr:hypothetical protein [Deltaproteobacteria bacterium]MBI3389046.1 hypothetical protein [Deltaproteobacteria bacterium]